MRLTVLLACGLCVSSGLAAGEATRHVEQAAEIAAAARFKAGGFAAESEVAADYRFGWSGLVAAHGTVRLTRTDSNYLLDGQVATVGPARLFWSLDGQIRGTANPAMEAIEFRQSERYQQDTKYIELEFDRTRVLSRQWREPGEQRPGKPKATNQAGVHSILSALLTVRSQSLAPGEQHSLLVTAADTVYLMDITVLDKTSLRVSGNKKPALKLDVRLRKITKDGQLKEHSKLGKTTLWLSDDQRRIPLRAEAQVFIGFVFVELI